jgi:hypothetical protein
MRRAVSVIAVTGCLLSTLPNITWAQGLPGLVLFSGVERENQLSYRLDYGTRGLWGDRYVLKIPAKKIKLNVSQININYPDYYDGGFDTKSVEVKVKGKRLPLQDVKWDKENHALQMILQEPIEADNKVEIVLNNVKNPPFGGTYYFDCHIISPTAEVPLPRYLGTWILDIG